MNRQYVDSSLATSVGYDLDNSILEIEFKSTGAIWQYFDVPESMYQEMLNGSIGKFFLANIKGQYSESRVG
jgi:hypothetical protein